MTFNWTVYLNIRYAVLKWPMTELLQLQPRKPRREKISRSARCIFGTVGSTLIRSQHATGATSWRWCECLDDGCHALCGGCGSGVITAFRHYQRSCLAATALAASFAHGAVRCGDWPCGAFMGAATHERHERITHANTGSCVYCAAFLFAVSRTHRPPCRAGNSLVNVGRWSVGF